MYGKVEQDKAPADGRGLNALSFRNCVFYGKTAVDPCAGERIENRHQRHTEEHAEYAEGASADGDGGESPEGGQADGFADYTGVDQVALKLL